MKTNLHNHTFARCFGVFASLALAPVLLALVIGVSIYLQCKNAAGKALMPWMWLPVLAAAIYPVHRAIESVRGHGDLARIQVQAPA